jgi:hypothetical protein
MALYFLHGYLGTYIVCDVRQSSRAASWRNRIANMQNNLPKVDNDSQISREQVLSAKGAVSDLSAGNLLFAEPYSALPLACDTPLV